MAVRFSLPESPTAPQLPRAAPFARRCAASVSEVALPQGGPRWRFATPLLSGAVRLGKLPAPSWAPCPRYPLGACLGARTPRMHSIGWFLAPRLRPASVPQGPFPGLRSPVTVRIAGDIPDVCAFYREECPPSCRGVRAGSAPVAARCARPPFRLRLPFGAHLTGGSGGVAAGGGQSEVKRSRSGATNGEPRTESLSEAAQPDLPAVFAIRQAGGVTAV